MTDDDTQDEFRIDDGVTRTQYGAVCWRKGSRGIEVLLVTSRDTGRWIVPKGWPIDGLPPEGAALREAWEEAGVEGAADAACLGLYGYDKVMGPDRSVPCVVAVFAVRVARLRNRFPEHRQRTRRWFAPDKAARKVDEPDLARLISGFVPPG